MSCGMVECCQTQMNPFFVSNHHMSLNHTTHYSSELQSGTTSEGNSHTDADPSPDIPIRDIKVGSRVKSEEDDNDDNDDNDDIDLNALEPMSAPTGGMVQRFPCKARNVCESHTSEAAFIELPANPQHGTTLYCSHTLCAGSGRAFRWCQVCEQIVAKRNFMKRHSHGLISSKRKYKPHNHSQAAKEALSTDLQLSAATALQQQANALSVQDDLLPISLLNHSDWDVLQQQRSNAQMTTTLTHQMPPSESLTARQLSLLSAAGQSMLHVRPRMESELESMDLDQIEPKTEAMELDPSQLFLAGGKAEDKLVESIGSLDGWNGAHIDSIFD